MSGLGFLWGLLLFCNHSTDWSYWCTYSVYDFPYFHNSNIKLVFIFHFSFWSRISMGPTIVLQSYCFRVGLDADSTNRGYWCTQWIWLSLFQRAAFDPGIWRYVFFHNVIISKFTSIDVCCFVMSAHGCQQHFKNNMVGWASNLGLIQLHLDDRNQSCGVYFGEYILIVQCTCCGNKLSVHAI